MTRTCVLFLSALIINPFLLAGCDEEPAHGSFGDGDVVEWCYPDRDDDSFGDRSVQPMEAVNGSCPEFDESGNPLATQGGDCNDDNAAIKPNAVEVCTDSVDNNCDGNVNENCGNGWIDADSDGYSMQVDCDDANYDVNPGAIEVCDGIDNNCRNGIDEGCNGNPDPDSDEDGWTVGQGDCNDSDPAIFPGRQEICGDGIDQNCSGGADEGCGGGGGVTCQNVGVVFFAGNGTLDGPVGCSSYRNGVSVDAESDEGLWVAHNGWEQNKRCHNYGTVLVNGSNWPDQAPVAHDLMEVPNPVTATANAPKQINKGCTQYAWDVSP